MSFTFLPLRSSSAAPALPPSTPATRASFRAFSTPCSACHPALAWAVPSTVPSHFTWLMLVHLAGLKLHVIFPGKSPLVIFGDLSPFITLYCNCPSRVLSPQYLGATGRLTGSSPLLYSQHLCLAHSKCLMFVA
ncbi:unnamed protein product [Rangifer tarandus platyrhynchus]|uniref:Uncharacterized protein n=1 Tax=Rangifer tarandus platyrhynchus TaxID=3082113 RepID=A0ABN8XUL8_RANTA|nr:unnamed protein product [Rangifer tarandus platyrhynchus]